MVARTVYAGWSYGGDHLKHFGILGQKWGVRRYQNEDGTLTEEGKRRYLSVDGHTMGLYNQVADRMNAELPKINKKYDKVDLNDDANNLQYTKEVRDLYQKHYRDVLAKDIGTDSSTLSGQKWLEDVLGYTAFDDEVNALEAKVKEKEKKETSKISSSSSKSGSSSMKVTDYSNKKMNQSQAINQAYSDLEKQIPNFNNLPLDKQDELFFNYINESGLYKWM